MIVAQRIGTIRHADRIVVIDEGRAVGIGTHDELMKNCRVYREIAMSQLSEKELADGGARDERADVKTDEKTTGKADEKAMGKAGVKAPEGGTEKTQSGSGSKAVKEAR